MKSLFEWFIGLQLKLTDLAAAAQKLLQIWAPRGEGPKQILLKNHYVLVQLHVHWVRRLRNYQSSKTQKDWETHSLKSFARIAATSTFIAKRMHIQEYGVSLRHKLAHWLQAPNSPISARESEMLQSW